MYKRPYLLTPEARLLQQARAVPDFGTRCRAARVPVVSRASEIAIRVPLIPVIPDGPAEVGPRAPVRRGSAAAFDFQTHLACSIKRACARLRRQTARAPA